MSDEKFNLNVFDEEIESKPTAKCNSVVTLPKRVFLEMVNVNHLKKILVCILYVLW